MAMTHCQIELHIHINSDKYSGFQVSKKIEDLNLRNSGYTNNLNNKKKKRKKKW